MSRPWIPTATLMSMCWGRSTTFPLIFRRYDLSKVYTKHLLDCKIVLDSSQLLVLVMQKPNFCKFQVVLYKAINMDNLDQSNKNVNLQNRPTNYHNQTRLQNWTIVHFCSFPEMIQKQIYISLKLKFYWSIKELNKQKNSLYRSLNSHTKLNMILNCSF